MRAGLRGRVAADRATATTARAGARGRCRMKTLSCGILVLNDQHELLLCHVTGAWHWDIPKGTAEPGESPITAALRETREECGLDFSDLTPKS